MSFTNPNQGISWAQQEIKINNTTLTTIRSWSGGGWSVDATYVVGAGKDPISISEGNNVYEDISFDIQETEFINIVEQFGGLEAVRSSGVKFTLTRILSNGQQTQKYTYNQCRFISASPTLSQGPEVAMVAVVIKPLSCQLNDSFKNELVGTLLGKAADFAGDVASDLVGSLL